DDQAGRGFEHFARPGDRPRVERCAWHGHLARHAGRNRGTCCHIGRARRRGRIGVRRAGRIARWRRNVRGRWFGSSCGLDRDGRERDRTCERGVDLIKPSLRLREVGVRATRHPHQRARPQRPSHRYTHPPTPRAPYGRADKQSTKNDHTTATTATTPSCVVTIAHTNLLQPEVRCRPHAVRSLGVEESTRRPPYAYPRPPSQTVRFVQVSV